MAITATLGSVVRIGPADEPILVRDQGVLRNPDSITVTVIPPTGSATSPADASRWTTLDQYPEGAFFFDYSPPFQANMKGKHIYRIVTQNPKGAFEGTIYFDPSPFAS